MPPEPRFFGTSYSFYSTWLRGGMFEKLRADGEAARLEIVGQVLAGGKGEGFGQVAMVLRTVEKGVAFGLRNGHDPVLARGNAMKGKGAVGIGVRHSGQRAGAVERQDDGVAGFGCS